MMFADLFAGIGGFRLALEREGWACTFSADIDDVAMRTYRANFGEGYDAGDIREIPGLPDVEVAVAGFPCQPYSIAGKRDGLRDHRAEPFFAMVQLLRESAIPVFLLENVPNLLSLGGGSVYARMKEDLEGAGYSVFEAVLDAANFGVPQRRKRVFIVGFAKALGVHHFTFTEETGSPVPVRNAMEAGDDSIPISTRWDTYIDLYQGKIGLEDVPFEVPKTRKALERADQGVDLTDCIFQMRSSGIRALSIDRPLPTLAVSVSGGGAMIPVYSRERRHLSLLEITRIMGFPDDWQFPVSRTDAIKQLANAVCPPVIRSVARDIEFALRAVGYSSSDARSAIRSEMSSPVGLTTVEVSG